MSQNWPKVTLALATFPQQEAWEIFSALAHHELGVAGIEDPTSTPTGLRAVLHFAHGEDAHSVETGVRALLARLALAGVQVVGSEYVEDRDWGEGWREFFKLTRVSARLFVAPPWEAKLPADAPEDAVLVVIEPGQAFGTGTHATTRLCLAILQDEVRRGDVWLDIGAGSGILSIAAVLLGAKAAVGLERDPICRGNFVENAALNGVGDRIHLVEGSTPREALDASLLMGVPPPNRIVCNMLSTEFEPVLAELRRIPADLVLSGFLEAEKQAIAALCEETGYRVLREKSLDEWTAFVLARNTAPSR